MSMQAHLDSTEALEGFRSALLLFLHKASQVVEQATEEVRRTRGWVQVEQRRHWEGEVQRRARALAQAEQELLSAKLVGVLDNLSARQQVVRRHREALQAAEEKLRRVRKWSRDFDAAMDPLLKSLDGFRSLVGLELPEAVTLLTRLQVTLADYHASPQPDPLPETASADSAS